MVNNNKQKVFIKESYKGKKKSGVLKKLIQSVLFGLLTGFVAAFVFVVFAPQFMKYFNMENEGPVVVQTGEEKKESNTQNEESQKDKEETAAEHSLKEQGGEKEVQPIIMEKIVPLDVNEYKALYKEFNDIVTHVKKSVVQIVIEKSDKGLISAIEKYRNIGLIVAENKKSFFILTSYFKDKKSAVKAVVGDSVNPVSIAGYNENTGIMIVKLNKEELSKEVYDSLEVAQLTVSNSNDLGKPVLIYGNICDGRPAYMNSSICSYERTNRFMDSTYSMLMTTAVMDEQATGVIINMDGKVSGFIDKNSKTKYKEAFGIAELKEIIEKLSNEEKIPILGIKAESVANKNIAKEIKDGVFVFETVDNTPAMDYGILPGDVIIKIDDHDISNMQQVQNVLRNCKSKQSVKIVLMRQKFEKYDKFEIELNLK